MTHYLWQNEGFPRMTWQDASLAKSLSEVNVLRGRLFGRLAMLGMREKSASMLDSVSQEVVNSSAIEGELLNRDSVRSSVAHQLGLSVEGLPKQDHYVEGVVQVMLDATQHYDIPLDEARLFGWHAALFPTGYSGSQKITVAAWRIGNAPMQVVSGAIGHRKVHFQAPDSDIVPAMMSEFLKWVNSDSLPVDPLVKAAVAHLWFVTVHPFDDGNGRLCRTITEMLLSKADQTGMRYYSLSSALMGRRNEYYQHLETAQKGSLDITKWILWFLSAMKDAITDALDRTEMVVAKAAFWDRHSNTVFNERQRKVMNMMLDGFEGKLNSTKWYKINHCSQDTANRDINDLIAKGVLQSTGEGGRSTNYELCKE